jgi:alpha-glucosidase
VKFYGGIVDDKAMVRSQVVNGDFALSEKWIIDKVTFIGLEKVKRFQEYEVEFRKRTNLKGKSVIKTRLDSSGQFVMVEVSKLWLPIGHDFKLELKPPRR